MISNKELGAIYTTERTIFRTFAPDKNNVKLRLFKDALSLESKEYNMRKDNDGVFEVEVSGDLDEYFYTYIVENEFEVTDPYSIASSINSNRSCVIDLSKTNPEGFLEHPEPPLIKPTDAIIYELHVKDFTAHTSSNIKHKASLYGMTEENTNYNGYKTGIDHLVELGITHVHLMPVFDYLTVREDREYTFDEDNYNWGYDPELYNTVEGSLTLHPDDPKKRIYEFKETVMAFHNKGIKVVLDVVYNHTFRGKTSNFNVLATNYYFRQWPDGSFSNGSGCGNEFDSQKPMARKFIIDSLKYWVREFRVDGFRFDLMALIDIDTIEIAVEELRKIKPDILIYGEPWMADRTPLPSNKTTSKGTQTRKSFALFNDNFRNAIKGDNDGYLLGFAQGNLDEKRNVETGIAGSIFYDPARIGFTQKARETINYVNSHDNLILQDKLLKVFPQKTEEEIKTYNKFVHSILFLSQGIPFIHAGNEFLRSKKGNHNTYNAPLSINAIDWSLKEKNIDVFNYIKDLIEFRKSHSAFRLDNGEEIRDRLKFFDHVEYCPTIAYTIKENGNYILVVHNANSTPCLLTYQILKKHIVEKYKDEFKDMTVDLIFDEHGIVRNNTNLNHANGVQTQAISTYAYKVKTIR